MEAPAAGRSLFASVSPLPKVCMTLSFLVFAVSLDRHDLIGGAVFAAVPLLLALAGGVGVVRMLRRAAAALPFVLCAGAADVFFDRAPVTCAGVVTVSGGVCSLLVLVAKTLATTEMVLLLAASSTLTDISGALVRLRVPCILVLQMQLLLRYMVLTAAEARGMANAYRLRNAGCGFIPMRDWGMLCGCLFLRSVGRADAVYKSMQCRLFHAGRPLTAAADGTFGEWCSAAVWFVLLLVLRVAV